MPDEIKTPEQRVSDQASIEALIKAANDCVDTCFTRSDTQKNSCKFGREGVCCRICNMGPCRITSKAPRGVCGADADTIVARNFLREVTSGAAAHTDHGRHLVLRLKKVAEENGNGYMIKDEKALRQAARLYKIDEKGRNNEGIAKDLANLFLEEFTVQEEKLKTLSLSPLKQQSIWQTQNIEPLGIDRMIVESMHRTHMGVDHNYRNILLQAFRTALSDG